jgi:hypothetical protein
MSRLLSLSAAPPDLASAPSTLESTQSKPQPILITEQQVAFATAVATSLSPAAPRPRMAARVFAAVRGLRIGLPEPRPTYPRRGASYFEAARMSREMDHL